MEYILFQDFARKITRPTPPPAQGPPSQVVHWNLATGPKGTVAPVGVVAVYPQCILTV